MQLINIESGNKISIITKSGIPISSRVCEVLDEHIFLIYTPIERNNITKFPIGKEYTFMFYTKDRLYKAKGKVLDYCIQNKVNLMKINADQFELIQRRQFFRVTLRLHFTYTRLKDKDEIEETESKESIPVYKGMIENLSGNGLCFSSYELLTTNEHILCNIILGNTSMEVEGKVLSADRFKYREDKFIHRVQLINLQREQQDTIVEFVFEKERELIKRRKLDEDIPKSHE